MPQATDPSDARVAFGDALVRAMKIMAAVRQRAPRVHPDVDPMGYPLMFNLREEPRRVSDIAAAIHLDVSTVSRQVSHLVAQGLVERLPDPSDGRAHVLTLTEPGRDLLVAIRERRNAWLAEVTADWDDADLADFDRLLQRFADDVAAHPLLNAKDLA
ncbi:MarR family winged helix-turn-helix transcriptional regulator [Knoellia aerolata]|uniref:MarR family winged helix-turn-helix transcriptional regulator n=1 Tax=Knoellia aerolata TaxID=442954 RepID=UPI000A06C479|nr:MarR family transcriptional regulator [Knoellia aerolata]